MILRIAEAELARLAAEYSAVAVIGPRQSGKTTLVRSYFPEKPYVNLENIDERNFALEDPRGFLKQFEASGAVLDEVQRTPELFSYLQQILDESDESGHFILTGSTNFVLQENITQSLAGRVGYLTLLPFSQKEIMHDTGLDVHQMLFKGFYPPLYDKDLDIRKWMNNYIRTYIERDVRQLKGIENLITFERFLRLCAGRVGQLLNKNELAVETGVDSKTIESWISVLEASFIVFRLKPFYKNFNKRVVKMPKLYFYDVGLASALLGVQESEQLRYNVMTGSLFENMMVVELLKQRLNNGRSNNLFFWRNSVGNEVDIIVDNFDHQIPIEIKSGMTVTKDYFKGIRYWNKLSSSKGGIIIYGGDLIQKRSDGIQVIPYNRLDLAKFEFE